MSDQTKNPASRAGHADSKRNVPGPNENAAPLPVEDATSPESKPQGTLEDQETTMESEGQGQEPVDPPPSDSAAANVEREQDPAEVEMRRTRRLDRIEGLTDNKAGG